MKRWLILASLLFLAGTLNAAANNQEITETAKVTFSLDKKGSLQALVVKYTETGSYPRSGWVNCAVSDPEIEKKYVEELKGKEKVAGYFTATYVITGENTKSPILSYHGVLLSLTPWEPAFLHKRGVKKN